MDEKKDEKKNTSTDLLKAIAGIVDLQLVPFVEQVNSVVEEFNQKGNSLQKEIEGIRKEIEEIKKGIEESKNGMMLSLESCEKRFSENIELVLSTITGTMQEKQKKMSVLLDSIKKALEIALQ